MALGCLRVRTRKCPFRLTRLWAVGTIHDALEHNQCDSRASIPSAPYQLRRDSRVERAGCGGHTMAVDTHAHKGFFGSILMESLILAQDKRWRRA
jgi:hypothetical protein